MVAVYSFIRKKSGPRSITNLKFSNEGDQLRVPARAPLTDLAETEAGFCCGTEWHFASVVVILGRFILVVLLTLGNGRTGDRVLAVDPAAQVDEPAAVGAEGKGREGVDRGDLVRLGAGWTASADHDSLFAACVGSVLAGSLLGELDDSVDGLDSAAGLAGSLDDLSAFSAFLYESLR